MGRPHAVQVYAESSELIAAVGEYLANGFAAGDPALVVATPEHRRAIEVDLASRGWDSRALARDEWLVCADAAQTLDSFMREGMPSPARFADAVGQLVAGLVERSPTGELRVFGEMVDILVQRGLTDAAIRLEELWNELARTQPFSLLCGYHLDLFDRAAQVDVLPAVCRTHSHVSPVRDVARLSRAVDRALDEVLGPREAGQVYLLVGERIRAERVPPAQVVLMWVSENMPALADRILASARHHYAYA